VDDVTTCHSIALQPSFSGILSARAQKTLELQHNAKGLPVFSACLFRLLADALAARQAIRVKHSTALSWTRTVIAVVAGVDAPFTRSTIRVRHHLTRLTMGESDLPQHRRNQSRMAADSRMNRNLRVKNNTERYQD
jgi:hypothetical protein